MTTFLIFFAVLIVGLCIAEPKSGAALIKGILLIMLFLFFMFLLVMTNG